jgi:hypothetical protein
MDFLLVMIEMESKRHGIQYGHLGDSIAEVLIGRGFL